MVCGCVCEEVVCEPPHPILGAVSDNLLHTQHTTHNTHLESTDINILKTKNRF